MRTFLRRLGENDPSLTGLTLTDDFPSLEFDLFLEVLQQITSLERIHLSRRYVASLAVMEQHQFWNFLSHRQVCPNVVSFSFADFYDNFPVPVSVLVRLLEGRQQQQQQSSVDDSANAEESKQQHGIRELNLSHVRLRGDMDQLRSTLKAHLSLEVIRTWDVDLVQEGPTSQQHVLQTLLDIHHLQALSLGSFTFHNDQIDVIVRALSRKDHQLRVLGLRGNCPNNHNNNPQNQDGRDPRQGQQATWLTADACAELAKMLRVNQSLEKLVLSNLQLVPDPPLHDINSTSQPTTASELVSIAQALQHDNRTLTSFHLFQYDLFHRHDMTSTEEEALVQMVQENHVMTSFLLLGRTTEEGAHSQQVEYYLKLNRAGLWGIQVDVNLAPSQVAELLHQAHAVHDVDCLYHFLRGNPTILPAG